MNWATNAKAHLDGVKASLEAGIAIIDLALPELEVGSEEEKAALDARSEMVLAVALVDSALLFVTPWV